MSGFAKFLPGTGRGTMCNLVEGLRRPSIIPAGCHLPVPGRNYK